jgi:alanine racemase
MATMRGHASLFVDMFRCGEVLYGLEGVDDTEVDLDIVIVVLECEL